MRRAGRVIAQGHRRVIAQKYRAGVADLRGQSLGIDRGNVQMLRGNLIRKCATLSASRAKVPQP